MWSAFGKLDAQRGLGESVPDAEWQRVVWDALARTSIRTEARSLALLHETALIALLSQQNERVTESESSYRALKEALGKVDASLSLYSQQEKRNVARDEYDDEVEALFARMTARQGT
jgi:hypothetical protein